MAYCTHAEVGYALRTRFPSVSGTPAGFTATTNPTLTEVNLYIDLTDAQIDMELAELGFKLPLTAISGEAIQTQQTNLLKLMSIFGAACKVVDSLNPAPAVSPAQRFVDGNLYCARFSDLFRLLKSTAGFGIRAQTWEMSRANRKLSTARAPMTGFREGLEGVEQEMGLWEYTTTLRIDQDLYGKDAQDWDWDALVGWQSFPEAGSY